MRRLALLAVALVLAACGGGTDEKPDAAAPADGIENLDSILALRSDFEADAGKPRLVILFSPT